MKMKRKLALIGLALTGMLTLPEASAQITNVVFSEDFSKPLDTNKLVADNIGFEGGKGTIAPTVANGVVEFTGAVTEQWWAGAAIRVAQTFPVNAETNVMMSVDRVAEAGTGTGHRSSIWITDQNQSHFVLFGYNSENNWEYNYKIGSASDNPTGGGTAIAAFNDAAGPYLDNALHKMKAFADGQSVKLYLDDVLGVEVPFPFNNLGFKIGSYARANADTADSTFDNLQVATVGLEAFSPSALTLVSGQTVSNAIVRIPAGVNQTQAVQVRVTSDTPSVAIPVGAVNGTLTLTFPAGGANALPLAVQSVGVGGAIFSLANDLGIGNANKLGVAVVQGPGVRLTDDFAAAKPDTTKWQVSTQSFETTGIGTFTVSQTGGQLVINGTIDQQSYWAGGSLKTVQAFTATPDLPLSFEIDRVAIDPTSSDGVTASTGARTGVYVTTADRSTYVFFGQDVGETGWEVNVSPGTTATGSGTAITAFNSALNDNKSHHMKLIADGSQVEVFLDNQSGGKFSFPVNAGVHFEIGAYARAVNDSVNGVFDNVSIQNIVPPVAVSPATVETQMGVNTNVVTVTVPRFLNATKAVTVTVTSQNPQVAIPQGAVNGALSLPFAAGAPSVQSFNVQAVGLGTTTFNVTNDQAVAVLNGVSITVINPLVPALTDNFTSGNVDTNKTWSFDATPLDATTPGTLTADSGFTVASGVLEMSVGADTGNWPGMSLRTPTGYVASVTAPVTFELDRVKLDYKLVTGTGALERTGIWVFDSTGANYVFFDDYAVHNNGTVGGWQYNAVIGQASDIALPAVGTVISAFTPPGFNDQLNHHMKVEVNGTDVKLFLDGVFGAAVPFPFSKGITFGFGSYVAAATDYTYGYFDNVVVSVPGQLPVSIGPLKAAKQANGDLVISWTGTGTLQSTASLPGGWANVSPAPSGTSYTITAASLTGQKFFRLSQ